MHSCKQRVLAIAPDEWQRTLQRDRLRSGEQHRRIDRLHEKGLRRQVI
jgi:hypothetical protein